MPNRFQSLRDLFEKVAFAGLKPEQSALPGPTTLGRKILIGAALAALAALLVGLGIVLQTHANKPEAAAAAEPPPAAPAAPLNAEKSREVTVEEIAFRDNRDETHLIVGTLRNLSARRIAHCEVSFDVTTRAGSQIGGVSTTVFNVAPHGTVRFEIPVPQKDAAFAMVRELHTD